MSKLKILVAIVIGLVVGVVLGLSLKQDVASVGGVNFERETFTEGFVSQKSAEFTKGLQVGDTSNAACLTLRDSDAGGYSYVTILDGSITATTTSCE